MGVRLLIDAGRRLSAIRVMRIFLPVPNEIVPEIEETVPPAIIPAISNDETLMIANARANRCTQEFRLAADHSGVPRAQAVPPRNP